MTGPSGQIRLCSSLWSGCCEYVFYGIKLWRESGLLKQSVDFGGVCACELDDDERVGFFLDYGAE